MKILLTGKPGSGKTILLENFVAKVPGSMGFITKEVRENGERTGFQLVSSLGKKTTLASVNSDSKIRVSRYGVEVKQLNTFLASLPVANANKLIYVDEIGQMELFSDTFKELVAKYLTSENNFIGTITSVYDDTFTKQVLGRNDIVLLKVEPDNRSEVKAILDGLSLNMALLKRLDPKVQRKLTNIARGYAETSKFTQLKKLFENAIKYVAESKVNRLSLKSYLVRGNTADHKVELIAGDFTCDCDLFNGVGDFKDAAGECSHIQAVKLII